MLAVMVGVCAVVTRRFVTGTRRGSGRSIEVMAGVWTFLMYVGLGAAPLAIMLWQEAR
jgi:hypothetical protein